jgi:hypothetical protein
MRTKKYKGYVHSVQQLEVLLMFSLDFHTRYIDNQPVALDFLFGEGPMLRRHQALDTCLRVDIWKDRLCFVVGKEAAIRYERPTKEVEAQNIVTRHILNTEQARAVKYIMKGAYGGLPYILFGPPVR